MQSSYWFWSKKSDFQNSLIGTGLRSSRLM